MNMFTQGSFSVPSSIMYLFLHLTINLHQQLQDTFNTEKHSSQRGTDTQLLETQINSKLFNCVEWISP